jgi:hypothetical protein
MSVRSLCVESQGRAPARSGAQRPERLRSNCWWSGVDKVKILGERPERIYVEFAQERLATLGVPPRDL